MPNKCRNPRCIDPYNKERTELPDIAKYCFVCGWPVSEKAIEKQKEELNNVRSRKLNEANNKISTLELKMVEYENCVVELKNAMDENQILKNELNEITKKVKVSNDATVVEKRVDSKYILLTLLLLIIAILVVAFFNK